METKFKLGDVVFYIERIGINEGWRFGKDKIIMIEKTNNNKIQYRLKECFDIYDECDLFFKKKDVINVIEKTFEKEVKILKEEKESFIKEINYVA